MSYRVEVAGVDKILNSLRSAPGRLEITMERILNDSSNRIESLMKQRAPLGRTGALRNSIQSQRGSSRFERVIGPTGGTGSRSFPLPKRYGYFVDVGNSPHFPNVQDIANRYGVDINQAFLIARRISEKPGQRYGFAGDTAQEVNRIVTTYINSYANMGAFDLLR